MDQSGGKRARLRRQAEQALAAEPGPAEVAMPLVARHTSGQPSRTGRWPTAPPCDRRLGVESSPPGGRGRHVKQIS